MCIRDRDTAIMYANILGAKVLLASATPSLETYHNALSQKYGLVTLLTRYGGVKMPEIDIEDIKYVTHRKQMKGVLFHLVCLKRLKNLYTTTNKLFYFKIEEVLLQYVVVSLVVGLLTVKAVM